MFWFNYYIVALDGVIESRGGDSVLKPARPSVRSDALAAPVLVRNMTECTLLALVRSPNGL